MTKISGKADLPPLKILAHQGSPSETPRSPDGRSLQTDVSQSPMTPMAERCVESVMVETPKKAANLRLMEARGVLYKGKGIDPCLLEDLVAYLKVNELSEEELWELKRLLMELCFREDTTEALKWFKGLFEGENAVLLFDTIQALHNWRIESLLPDLKWISVILKNAGKGLEAELKAILGFDEFEALRKIHKEIKRQETTYNTQLTRIQLLEKELRHTPKEGKAPLINAIRPARQRLKAAEQALQKLHQSAYQLEKKIDPYAQELVLCRAALGSDEDARALAELMQWGSWSSAIPIPHRLIIQECLASGRADCLLRHITNCVEVGAKNKVSLEFQTSLCEPEGKRGFEAFPKEIQQAIFKLLSSEE